MTDAELLKAAFLRGASAGVSVVIRLHTHPGEGNANRLADELDACVSELLTAKDAA